MSIEKVRELIQEARKETLFTMYHITHDRQGQLELKRGIFDYLDAIEKALDEKPESQSGSREEIYEYFLQMRNITNKCPKCNGFGVRSYSNTSVWSHGIGGQMITSGVCDECWGTGDINNKGVNLREYAQKQKEIDRLEAELALYRRNFCEAHQPLDNDSFTGCYACEMVKMAERIKELAKQVDSNNFWKDIILTEDGKLDVNQVEKELVDYRFMMEQVPKVYMYATGDKLSKCNYYAASVISAIDDHIQVLIEQALKEK